jgi:hypothetical protein
MRKRLVFAAMTTAAAMVLVSCTSDRRDPAGQTASSAGEPAWRSLPLITDGKVDPAWFFTGYGTFAVDHEVNGGALRTDCDARGLGLLVYGKERFGDCQIRVVYRLKDPRSNSGVYIRIADAIAQKAGEQPPPATRDADGGLTPDGLKAMQDASERDLGPWYAVHHGYEVQIADAADEFHRTGAVYSLTKAEAAPLPTDPAGWRTMLITLEGQRVTVDLDGKRVSTFDATARDLPARKAWHEPKREPVRPTKGYIGLQTHDPGDVVWFKEVSVLPL